MVESGEPTGPLSAVATAIITVLVDPSPTCLCSWSVTFTEKPPL